MRPQDPKHPSSPSPDLPASPPRADGFETICSQLGDQRLTHKGCAAPPIYQTSTFVFPDCETFAERDQLPQPRYLYSRDANPTTNILETKIAQLECGAWARGFGAGNAAIATAIGLCTHAGAHIIAMREVYGSGYLTTVLPLYGVETTFIRAARLHEALDAFRDNTRLLYIDSPNGNGRYIPDVAPLIAAAKARGVRILMDNSWATPYFQNPLEFGADLVVHSASKYIGGHSDVIGGFLIGRDPALHEQLIHDASLMGNALDPFAAWLLLRGLRTLAVRMRQHERTGLAVARMLAEHPAVKQVWHPGLPCHPDHDQARQRLRGYAGVFSFDLHQQTQAANYAFIDRLRLFGIGVSWGGFESLAITGSHVDPELGYTEQNPYWSIRLHCGLETTEDLVADVKQALDGVAKA